MDEPPQRLGGADGPSEREAYLLAPDHGTAATTITSTSIPGRQSNSEREGRAVGTQLIVEIVREPTAKRHPNDVAEEPDWHSPCSFVGQTAGSALSAGTV